MENHVYNLIIQLAQENKSLWKIRKYYAEDAGDCGECKEFWAKMLKDKEAHVRELMQLLKGHL